jgi:hypothetical protein
MGVDTVIPSAPVNLTKPGCGLPDPVIDTSVALAAVFTHPLLGPCAITFDYGWDTFKKERSVGDRC